MQRDYWNGDPGKKWVIHQEMMDSVLAPIARLLLECAAAKPGERVIDIGCGTGATSLAIAESVGRAASGGVLGVDISEPMVERATARAAGTSLPVQFRVADAATLGAEGGRFDLAISRFGVMFFEDPIAAFTNIRSLLSPHGRIAFICWRAVAENPWVAVPMSALADVLPETPPSDPHAPGPFAFADGARVTSILTTAGFRDVELRAAGAEMRLGDDAAAAAEFAATFGAAARALGVANDPALTARAKERLRATFSARGEGPVRLGASVWVVSAKA